VSFLRSGAASKLLGSGLLRAETSREGDRATTLELLFDLVYAFAFTQVTALMVEGETGIGVIHGLVILGLLWGPWSSFAWLSNQAHADRGVVRVGVITATVIMFAASLAVPAAYRAPNDPVFGALLFAVCYLLVQIVHTVVYLLAAGTDAALRRQIVLTELSAMFPAAALLVIGALVGAPFQVWIWLVAFVLQWLMIYLTSNGGNWRVNSVAHFAERHGLVVLLALGESVVAIGTGAARLVLDASVLVGAVFAIGIGIGMWWSYFPHLAPNTERLVTRKLGVERSGMATETYTYLHFTLIAGIVIAALGIETTMAEVADAAASGWFPAIALGGGVSLYLAGTGLVWRRVSGEWAVLRFAAATLALVLIPALAFVPALLALALVLLVVLALAVAEQLLGPRAKLPARPGASTV